MAAAELEAKRQVLIGIILAPSMEGAFFSMSLLLWQDCHCWVASDLGGIGAEGAFGHCHAVFGIMLAPVVEDASLSVVERHVDERE